MKHWFVRIAALLLFGISFALPAVTMGSPGPGAKPLAGYMCAFFASGIAFKAFFDAVGHGLNRDAVLLPLSGLVNYLFLLILVLSFWRRLVWIRLASGVLMLGCFAAVWEFFSTNQITPLTGHYLWVAGGILIFVPDVVMALSRRPRVDAAAAANDRVKAGS